MYIEGGVEPRPYAKTLKNAPLDGTPRIPGNGKVTERYIRENVEKYTFRAGMKWIVSCGALYGKKFKMEVSASVFCA